MKLIFRNCIIIFGFIFSFISCKAQTIYPLNTYPLDVPVGSYLKDLNNELNPYIGRWKASHNGKYINIEIIKEEHKSFRLPDKVNYFFQDVLVIKYTIKDSNGNILQSNTSSTNDNDKNFIASISIRPSGVYMFYTGNDCGIGLGEIIIKKINNTQLSWSYYPKTRSLTTSNCFNLGNIQIYLPVTENLIFTKQ